MNRQAKEELKKKAAKATVKCGLIFDNPVLNSLKKSAEIEKEFNKLEKNDYVSVGKFVINKTAEKIKNQEDSEKNLQALKNTADLIMFVLYLGDPKINGSRKNDNIDKVAANGISVYCGKGKIYPNEAMKSFSRDNLANKDFDPHKPRNYIIDTELMNFAFKKMVTKVMKFKDIKEDKEVTPITPALIVDPKSEKIIDATVIGDRAIVPGAIAKAKEEVIPFKVSAPTKENTFVMNTGETVEPDAELIPVNLEAEKEKLDYVAKKVQEYLGNVPMHFEKMPNDIINLSIIRPNGYTENYAVDIFGIIDGGTKPRVAVRTQYGELYIPIDEPLVGKCLATKFYACTPEEFTEIVDKYCYTPSMYSVIDFSGIKNDIVDNRKFKANLAITLAKITEKVNPVPRMRVKYVSDNEFKLISDNAVKTPFPGMNGIRKGFTASFKDAEIKINQ